MISCLEPIEANTESEGEGKNATRQDELCDSVFLDTAFDWTVFYNDDGLISEYMLESDTILKLLYNTNKKLEWLHTPAYSRYYAYDIQNRVQYILNIFNWTEGDSLAFEYPNEDHRASAVNYYKTGNLIRREEYSWNGENPSQVNIHLYLHNTSYSVAFEYDNNPKPTEHVFPRLYFEFPDASFGVNNITKETLYHYGDNKPLDVYEYQYYYNEDNLPVRLEWDHSDYHNFRNYTYRCTPRIRG